MTDAQGLICFDLKNIEMQIAVMFGQFNIWVGWFEIKKDNIRSVQARWPYSIRQLTIELMNSLKELQSIIYPKRENKKTS